MKLATRAQIVDEAVCISHSPSMTPTILLPCKKERQIGLFSLGMADGLEGKL